MAPPAALSKTCGSILILLLTLLPSAHLKVSMWIGEDEVRAFAGVPMEIKIIEHDKLADYVRRGPKFTAGLPPIPPLADSINVTWTSGRGKGGSKSAKYTYKFLRIRAEDPTIMEGLQLSIPRSGVIPRHPTDFRVSLPCTGLKAGIANFKLVFEVRNEALGKPLEGSPIRLKLGKYCRLQNETCLVQKCDHGGTCTPYGDCLCQKGYVGRRCEHSANCRHDCHRRGVCIRDDICKCRPGFKGKYCQRRASKRGGSSGSGGATKSKGGKGRKRGDGKGRKGGKKDRQPMTTMTPTYEPRFTNEVETYPAATTASTTRSRKKKRLSGETIRPTDEEEEKLKRRQERRKQRRLNKQKEKHQNKNNVTSPSKMR